MGERDGSFNHFLFIMRQEQEKEEEMVDDK